MINRPVAGKLTLTFIGVMLLLAALFLRLDHNALRGEEPRRALISLEMELSGDLICPTINGVNYYNKLPGYNWFHIGLFRLTGSYEEWVMRLPGVVALLLTGFVIFLFTNRYLGNDIAIMSALSYMTSVDILFYFSMLGEIDLFYTFIVFMQVASLFHFSQQRKWTAFYLVSYFFMTAGLMTKGLPSPVFQVLTFLALAVQFRSIRFLFYWQHLAGIMLALVFFGGYLYLFNMSASVEVLLVKIITESSERTLLEHGAWSVIKTIATFPLILLKILLPWALFLLFCIHKGFAKHLKDNSILYFSILFIAINAFPYLLSPGLKERYLYPFLPMGCLLLIYYYHEYRDRFATGRKVIRGVTFTGAIIVLAAFLIIPWSSFAIHIPAVWLVSTSGVLFSCFLGYLIIKSRVSLFWGLFFLMILVRLGIDGALIPIQKQEMNKREYEIAAEEILKLTGEEKIWLTGPLQSEEATFDVGSNQIISQKYLVPPRFPWDLSYYLSRGNKHVVEHTNEPPKRSIIIKNVENELQVTADTLYTFTDPKYNNTYLFLRIR